MSRQALFFPNKFLHALAVVRLAGVEVSSGIDVSTVRDEQIFLSGIFGQRDFPDRTGESRLVGNTG